MFCPGGSQSLTRVDQHVWYYGMVLHDPYSRGPPGPSGLRGTVLAAGGAGIDYYGGVNSTEVYSPTTGTWAATGSLVAAARIGIRMVLLSNGNILAAGGGYLVQFSPDVHLASAEVYNPTIGTWTATGSMTIARAGFEMVRLPNGNVLAAGGVDYTNFMGTSASAEVYNPTTGIWTATGSFVTARTRFQMVVLPDGRVLAAGGESTDLLSLDSAEVYNPTSGIWTATGSLISTRLDFQMVLLINGKVLAAGGRDETEYRNGRVSSRLASAELYNPTTGTWTTTGSLASARQEFQMVGLPGGNVLAAGGFGEDYLLASAEVYSLTSGTWTATSPLAIARQDFQMVLLPSGSVLAAGGATARQFISDPLASAEVYSPTIGTWTATNPLASARYNFQMVAF